MAKPKLFSVVSPAYSGTMGTVVFQKNGRIRIVRIKIKAKPLK